VQIEAVVVCVNYSDFLAYTLPANRSQFNNMVVVTDTKDEATVAICNKYNVRCVQTDAFYDGGNRFNKASGINAGLAALRLNGWVVHMDADIMLPPLTRYILEKLPLDPSKIYGVDRLMCTSHEEWMHYLESARSVHESWAFLHLNLFSVGSRLVQYGEWLEDGAAPDGWVPIGYFQLWHPSATECLSYPGEHGAADRTDVLHAKQYDRAHRELIPEIAVIHLDSEAAPMGTNWCGRQTARFGHRPPIDNVFTRFIGALLTACRRALRALWLWLQSLFMPSY
jgi:hypothetical protein